MYLRDLLMLRSVEMVSEVMHVSKEYGTVLMSGGVMGVSKTGHCASGVILWALHVSKDRSTDREENGRKTGVENT